MNYLTSEAAERYYELSAKAYKRGLISLTPMLVRLHALRLPLTEIPGRTTPPAAVVVAVKNASDVSRAFFGRLRHQAYPDYRIIAPVESEEDPAFTMVTEESKRPRTDHRRRRRPPKPGSSRGAAQKK
jgi:hypothetical protein